LNLSVEQRLEIFALALTLHCCTAPEFELLQQRAEHTTYVIPPLLLLLLSSSHLLDISNVLREDVLSPLFLNLAVPLEVGLPVQIRSSLLKKVPVEGLSSGGDHSLLAQVMVLVMSMAVGLATTRTHHQLIPLHQVAKTHTASATYTHSR